MRKTEVSVEGLRILRTEAEIVLKDWEKSHPPSEGLRRQNLREAVREASERLEVADMSADARAPGATQ